MEDVESTPEKKEAPAPTPKAEAKPPKKAAPKKVAKKAVKKPVTVKTLNPSKTTGKAKAKPKKVAKKAAKKKSHPILQSRNRKPKKAGKKKALDKTTLNIKVLPAVAVSLKKKADKLTNGNFTVAVVNAMNAWQPSQKDAKKLKESRRTTRV